MIVMSEHVGVNLFHCVYLVQFDCPETTFCVWANHTRVSMEVIVTIGSKLGYFTYLRDLQPTFIGFIIHLY